MQNEMNSQEKSKWFVWWNLGYVMPLLNTFVIRIKTLLRREATSKGFVNYSRLTSHFAYIKIRKIFPLKILTAGLPFAGLYRTREEQRSSYSRHPEFHKSPKTQVSMWSDWMIF